MLASGVQAAPGENLALKQRYALSSTPNYAGATDDARTLLTDGDRGTRNGFWNNGTTLGWMWRPPVAVTLNLADTAAVDRVRVYSAGRRTGDAFLPSMLLAYGATGSGEFGFLGATPPLSASSTPQASTVRAFDIRFEPRTLSRVVVVSFPGGPYQWLSEIEVRAAESSGARRADGMLAVDEVLRDATRRRREAIAALPGRNPTGPALTRRWAMPLENGFRTASGCTIERIEPWSDDPPKESRVDLDAPLIVAPGGIDYVAYRITNAGEASRAVSVGGKGRAVANITWHALAHVRARNYAWVADVVTSFSEFALPARSTMVVFAKVSALASHTHEISLEVGCGERKLSQRLQLRVVPSAAAVDRLYGTLFVYTHEKPHSHVARAMTCDPEFLARYAIDSQVVHPNALLDDGRSRPTALLARYFSEYRNARRLLLFMDVKTRPWAFKYQPDQAKAIQSLRRWWDWVRRLASAAGVQGEIVLFPVDEAEPADVPLVLRTRDLLRRAGITAPLYATVGNRSVVMMLADLEIVQLHTPNKLLRSALGDVEVHSYFTRYDARLLSPNSYYRLQGWQAFELGLSGVGFWSLWDTSAAADPASGWDIFNGQVERDYGAFYQAEDGCGLASRRLLAWRRGIEENRLLRACTGDRMVGERRTVGAAHGRGSSAQLRSTLEKVTTDCR